MTTTDVLKAIYRRKPAVFVGGLTVLTLSGLLLTRSHRTRPVPTYTVVDLGTLGGRTSTARAINQAGEVGGAADTNRRSVHAFLWQAGRMTDLGTVTGFVNSQANALNDRGDVVGIATNDAVPNYASGHPFLYRGGRMRDVGVPPGSTWGEATAVSASGGVTVRGEHDVVPEVAAVNAAGHKAATRDVANGSYHDAFFWNGFWWSDLGPLPGDVVSSAEALNDADQVVGVSSDDGKNPRAFLWQDGRMADLNTRIPPGSHWRLNEATGINNRGFIVGAGEHNGLRHGFLLIPH